MSWQCRLIQYAREKNGKTLQIGDMFFGPTKEEVDADEALPEGEQVGLDWLWHYCRPEVLSEFYRQNNAHRRPLLVFLPGRSIFCVDGACWNHEGGKANYYGGWQVSGEAPNITVSPSINCVGSYHGWLQKGVISDDCEGRTFDEMGRNIR